MEKIVSHYQGGTKIKKNRTRAEGLSLGRAYKSSGLSLREFSKKHDVTECSVQYWCNQLRKSELVSIGVRNAQFVEVKTAEKKSEAGAASVKVGAAEISFLALPEASWMSEFVVTVNRYV